MNTHIPVSEDASVAPIMIPAIATDGSLYPVEKLEAHQKGLHHQAISAFVFSEGKLLIQRRAEGKYHCAGQWANTCCTHPHFGEDFASAAHRRLREELGFSCELEELGTVDYSADVGGGLREWEQVRMFKGSVDAATLEYALNPDEVAEIRWVDSGELRREMQADPERFTPWFRIYMDRYPDMVFEPDQ